MLQTGWQRNKLSLFSSYGICCEQSDTGTSFLFQFIRNMMWTEWRSNKLFISVHIEYAVNRVTQEQAFYFSSYGIWCEQSDKGTDFSISFRMRYVVDRVTQEQTFLFQFIWYMLWTEWHRDRLFCFNSYEICSGDSDTGTSISIPVQMTARYWHANNTT
jgi:hypothetical protein